jgi:hypothetical protein
MSAEVQKIVEVFRTLSPAQQAELLDALQAAEPTGKPRSRTALVRSLRGKYAHVLTSSEAFAARKQDELALEERAGLQNK